MLCLACKTEVQGAATKCPSCGEPTPVDLDVTADYDGSAVDDRTPVIDGQGWSRPFVGSDTQAYEKSILRIGSILCERYEILKILGEGGMGAVYKAHDREVDHIVALKVIRPELAGNPEIVKRFRQELVLARQITNRNVVRIYDLGVDGGFRFISMEYIEGQELADMLRSRVELPPKEAAEIMLQVCRGLSAAHAEGVVHRDLKPQNVMIDKTWPCGRNGFWHRSLRRRGHYPTVEMWPRDAATSHLTRVGALLGTPRYMSPEQARAEKVDHRSDLFTVGLILYELTVGEPPAPKTTLLETLWERSRIQIPPLLAADPRIPRQLNDIVGRCLKLNPAERYQSADEIVRDLEGGWPPKASPHQLEGAFRNGCGNCASVGALVLQFAAKTHASPGPVKILISDFVNDTGDPVLNGTLNPP